MSYQTALQQPNVKLDVVMIIDGVPVLFGTRSGRTHDGVNVANPPAGTWASSAAIVRDSIKLGEQSLDMNSLFVKPAKVSLSLAISPAWDMYFEPLRGPIGTLGASLNLSNTTVTFDPVTANQFGESTYCYIDRETILLGVSADPTFTGCTRGCIALPGNRPSAHVAMDGIYSQPPYMIGRRVTLRIYAGDGDSDYRDLLGYRIAASPEYDLRTGTWSISLDDGMSAYATKMATGFSGAIPGNVYSTAGLADETVFQFIIQENYGEWLYGSEVGGAMVSAPSGDTFLCKVESITTQVILGTTYPLVNIRRSAFKPSQTSDGLLSREELFGCQIRRIYYAEQYPMRAVLKGLLSREGDGANGTWDTMAGSLLDGANPPPVASTGGSPSEFCMGANIDHALVDVTALEAFADQSCAGWTYFFGVKPDMLALDLLEEAAWALGGIFVNGSNGLTFKKFQGTVANSIIDHVLTEAVIARDTDLKSVNDESSVLHTVTIDCNHLPPDQNPQVHVQVTHNRTKRMYRDTPVSRAGTLQLSRKGTWINGDAAIVPVLGNAPVFYASQNEVRQQADRICVKRGKPIQRYTIKLPWRYSHIVPGDRASVTHSLLNSFDGNSVNAQVFDVVGVALDYNTATVTIKVDSTTAGKLIAPALRVTAYVANFPIAGHCTLTLEANNVTWGGGSNPALFFAVGWAVAIHDRSSAPAFSTTSSHIVAGTNGVDTIELINNAGFTPVAGDIVQLQSYDAAVALTNANQAQNAKPSDYAFLADSSLLLGASNAAPAKWG